MANVFGRTIETESLSSAHWFAFLLVLVTGVIHIYAGVIEGRIPVALAGVGFLAAIVLFLVDYRRSLLYLIGILFTAVQIPLWYVAKAGEYTMLGYFDKTVQVVLILVLAVLYYSNRTNTTTTDESVAA